MIGKYVWSINLHEYVMMIEYISAPNLLQLCQRICLFNEVAKTCKCLHPLFTDFDALRDPKFTTNETSPLNICNLIAGGMLYEISNWRYLYKYKEWIKKYNQCNTQCWYFMIESDEVCIDSILRNINKGEVFCPCRVSCNETEYEAKLSSSKWPSDEYEVKHAKILRV